MNLLSSVPIIYICVGTPPDAQGNCDCSAIFSALKQISSMSEEPRVVCIKSTISPGTIKKIETSLEIGSRISLVYNPEFMREGAAIEDIQTKNPIVLGSTSPAASKKIENLYCSFLETNPELEVIRTTPETAELIKYGWNGFSAIRISYINELSRLCNSCSADIGTLIQGIAWSEKVLPTSALVPGCGYGGSCLPKDTLALSHTFEQYDFPRTLVHQAIDSNRQHIDASIDRIVQFIGGVNEQVAILGIAFKANTDDIRYSSSIPIIRTLLNRGCSIRVYDAHAMEALNKIIPEVICCASPYEAVEKSDCIIILTDSDEIQNLDLDRVASLASNRRLVDFKNLFSPELVKEKGFSLINLGRFE